ncbi:type II toxin-antitoxin system YafQ family toxin [Loigolactobacillus rennini]|uniref:RelE family toxin-antitoxin system n=1 Tax=Loigolactobacillus rennini DSM 20253 TaxID=1423796 RepID=A0A0R2D2H6_9LACO|nr:type II toxin-antitoxin system YafQ family toxin [Loigolactobacillus rennini]KRM94683.1 RelE family toxin-antitoxin system [Loigolactobacillus rennini DSM 20253]
MKIKQTKKFKRELKKLAKKHFPVKVLIPCLKAIIEQDKPSLIKIKDHALTGSWSDYREFHPARYGNYGKAFDNWIVVYKINQDELILLLVTTGNHDILG